MLNDDGSPMGSPHWVDIKSNTDPNQNPQFPDGNADEDPNGKKPNNVKSYAYSYISDQTAEVYAKFKWNSDTPPLVSDKQYYAEAVVIDTTNCGFKLPRKALIGNLIYPVTVSENDPKTNYGAEITKKQNRRIEAHVTANRTIVRSDGTTNLSDNLKPLTIEWTVYDKYEDGIEVGKSKSTHTIYVTYVKPSTGLRQETLFNLSCVAAKGMFALTDHEKNAVTDKIYSEFQDREIKRMDGEVLGYYRGPAELNNVSQILEISKISVNGQCGCFADLLQKSLAINGVKCLQYRVKPIFSDAKLGMLVKNWAFANGSLPGPWTHRFNKYEPSKSEVTSLPSGVQGQGKINPTEKLFKLHFVVIQSDRIFDPSYGTGPYTGSSINWEFASLDGFVSEGLHRVSATDYQLISVARIEKAGDIGTVLTPR